MLSTPLRFVLALFALTLSAALATASSTARAEPEDIQAAARGVVRVVIIDSDGTEVFPLSHGTGFAVSPTRIVTNAHVVREAAMDDELRIGIVPSDGDDASYARIIGTMPGKDLALLEITGDLRLPALSIAGVRERDGAEVVSVGYPMNVDRAQGLEIGDIFQPQPTVNSRGFISGQRPSRQFDSILHTAPIARGNSGGPLLDQCGRVLGVNSFGAESGGSDAEFFFAVSNRELLPFLRDNGVTPRVNSQPCRSIADLDAAERARLDAEQAQSQAQLAARSAATREQRDQARREAEMKIRESRENQMALAMIALLIGAGAAFALWQGWGREDGEKQRMIAGSLMGIALIAALALWFTRPGLDAVDRETAAILAKNEGSDSPQPLDLVANGGVMVCSLETERSRYTGTPTETVEFSWAETGCVNGRTQYGYNAGEWSRVFVPNSDQAVSLNRFDPAGRTYRTDRYLLTASVMAEARKARSAYSAPKCGSENAAGRLGELQGAVTSVLPDRPNERLVYSCQPKE